MKSSEDFVQRTCDKCKITIYIGGWFNWQDITSEKLLHGRVKLDGNKLTLTDASGKPIKITDVSTKVSTLLTLDISADGKNILLYDSQKPFKRLRKYVKQ